MKEPTYPTSMFSMRGKPIELHFANEKWFINTPPDEIRRRIERTMRSCLSPSEATDAMRWAEEWIRYVEERRRT